MEKTFTPGPWIAVCGEPWEYKQSGNILQTCEVHTEKTRAQLNEEGHSYEKYLADVSNITVCSIGTFQKDILGDEAKANALLIAAAPDLFDVCKELYEWSLQNDVRGPIFPKLEAALNKATGTQAKAEEPTPTGCMLDVDGYVCTWEEFLRENTGEGAAMDPFDLARVEALEIGQSLYIGIQEVKRIQ